MDSYIYKEQRLSKTEEMFRTVFTSKAVLSLVTVSFIVCAGSIAFALNYFILSSKMTLENAEMIMSVFPEFEGDITDIYAGIFYMTQFLGISLLVFGGVYLWIAIGVLVIYRRSKAMNSQYSPRAGFTMLQALGITKIVFEGLATFIGVLAGLGMLSDRETFVSGIITCVFVAVNFMYSVSITAFCTSVKKTIDGISAPSSTGAGTLQFSAFITGIFTGIVSVLFIILTLVSAFKADMNDVSIQLVGLDRVLLRFVCLMGILFLSSVTHFLIFAIVRHYAKKLPLAENAERVYKQNMSNIYPEQQYSPNQFYQSPQQNNINQPYQQENYNGYVPYQSQQNYNNGYSTYNPTGDVDAASHSQPDNTPYPPYDDMTRKY